MFSVRIRILGKSFKKVGMKKIVENNLGPNKARILFLIVYVLIVAYLKLISIEKYFRLRILIIPFVVRNRLLKSTDNLKRTRQIIIVNKYCYNDNEC